MSFNKNSLVVGDCYIFIYHNQHRLVKLKEIVVNGIYGWDFAAQPLPGWRRFNWSDIVDIKKADPEISNILPFPA